MAESNSIAKLSHMHIGIMDYMVANPQVSKGQVAAHFGVTRTWLSIVINSHAFQDMLKQRQDQFFGAVVVPLREKMIGVADQALDRLAEKIEVMESAEALETADKLLHRLGFAPNTKLNGQVPGGQQGAVMQQTNFFVGADILNSARAKFGQAVDREIIDAETLEVEETKRELPSPT